MDFVWKLTGTEVVNGGSTVLGAYAASLRSALASVARLRGDELRRGMEVHPAIFIFLHSIGLY